MFTESFSSFSLPPLNITNSKEVVAGFNRYLAQLALETAYVEYGENVYFKSLQAGCLLPDNELHAEFREPSKEERKPFQAWGLTAFEGEDYKFYTHGFRQNSHDTVMCNDNYGDHGIEQWMAVPGWGALSCNLNGCGKTRIHLPERKESLEWDGRRDFDDIIDGTQGKRRWVYGRNKFADFFEFFGIDREEDWIVMSDASTALFMNSAQCAYVNEIEKDSYYYLRANNRKLVASRFVLNSNGAIAQCQKMRLSMKGIDYSLMSPDHFLRVFFRDPIDTSRNGFFLQCYCPGNELYRILTGNINGLPSSDAHNVHRYKMDREITERGIVSSIEFFNEARSSKGHYVAASLPNYLRANP